MRYPGQESALLEFKKELPKNLQVVKTMVAFCNTFGGRLVIGVEDNGMIVGVSEELVQATVDSLQESIYRSCTPPILPFIYTQRIADKMLIIIEVSSGMNKPYFITSVGLQKGAYIRLGAHTYHANELMIQELQWQSRGLSVDAMPVYQASIENMDREKIKKFLENRLISDRAVDIDSALRHYRLLTEEHLKIFPTTAGILLFGKFPQQFLTEAFIICTHFKGTSGREAIASVDCEGDLFSQLEQSLHFIVKHLEKSFEIKGIKRKEQLEIPEEALREVMINAIVHRHYQIPGPTKVAIYDDRIEVFTPGNFPGPLQQSQLEMGYTYIRNQVICRIFRECGLIEKLGSGLLTLFQKYREYNLSTPTILEGDNFVKYILPRQTSSNIAAPEDDYKASIMRLFLSAQEITTRDITKHLSISRQTANRILQKLIKENLIKKIGESSATRYQKK